MIDREARNRFAFALRQFALGGISEHQMEEAIPENTWDHTLNDVAEHVVFNFEDYPLYHDYYLTGRNAISRESRRIIARIVLFLRSDMEYCVPNPNEHSYFDATCLGVVGLIIGSYILTHSLIVAGSVIIAIIAIGNLLSRDESGKFWPFESEDQLKQAAARRHY